MKELTDLMGEKPKFTRGDKVVVRDVGPNGVVSEWVGFIDSQVRRSNFIWCLVVKEGQKTGIFIPETELEFYTRK